MALNVNSNIASLNAQRNLNTSQSALTTSLQRLSSGLRINSAKDDAAGFAIAERFTSQIRGNDQAARNANDGISLAQTASGDLDQIGANLQRVRELAVQASNASNSASDRASLNNEANQLIQEIDRVAKNSSFNGTKLLDGSFAAKSFQVGANSSANDQISIASIASARTTALGVGSSSSYSTTKTGTANVAAGVLAAGDLTINGKNVAATVADGVSFIGSASSGIAKAAAINAVSGDTGVTATVAATVVTGTAITAAGATTAIGDGDLAINGVNIGAISAATGATAANKIAERGSQISAAINAKSDQTGVTATFDVTTGAVALTAADGRNITVGSIGYNTTLAANTAVVATTTSGLGSATTVGGAVGDSAYAVALAGTTTHSTLTLSSSGSAGITLGSGGGTAATTPTTATSTFTAVAAGDLSVNGVALEAFTNASTDNVALLAAINRVTGQTGVTAALSGSGQLTLTSTTGAIEVVAKGSATETNTTFATGRTVIAGVGVTAASLAAGTKAATATAGAGVSSIDFSTAASATAALDTIDAAINTIAKTQGALGAYQNRFESTIASLQTTSENLTASRSRIKDADFAKETAALSRAQVLQQAGTAILAQANQSSQGVLSLLR